MNSEEMFRLVTRSDFDGLICAVILKEAGLIDRIWFVHPTDVQDGRVALTRDDITANLPFSREAHFGFDHHASELERVGEPGNYLLDPTAPSAARLVYDSFGGRERFSDIPDEMMAAVDKADTADYGRDEILNPEGWTLLSFLLDSRTGLTRDHGFRLTNHEMMMELIDRLPHTNIEEILSLPDVQERLTLYREHAPRYREQISESTEILNDLAVVDLRAADPLYVGNRFIPYALFPDVSLALQILPLHGGRDILFAMGHSPLTRGRDIDVGELALAHGGGGHSRAGACRIPAENAEAVKADLIEKLSSKQRGEEDKQ